MLHHECFDLQTEMLDLHDGAQIFCIANTRVLRLVNEDAAVWSPGDHNAGAWVVCLTGTYAVC